VRLPENRYPAPLAGGAKVTLRLVVASPVELLPRSYTLCPVGGQRTGRPQVRSSLRGEGHSEQQIGHTAHNNEPVNHLEVGIVGKQRESVLQSHGCNAQVIRWQK